MWVIGAAPALRAQGLNDLRNDPAAPDAWLTHGTGCPNQRYRALTAIDKAHAAKLRPVWNDSLNNSPGQESQPVICDRVTFVTTHIGFVASADAPEVLAATHRALANGGLQRGSAKAGVTGVEPASPPAGAAFGLAALVRE